MLHSAPAHTAPCRRTALVLGLGASGLAMALWLARQGWRVRVADNRAAPPQLPALQAALPDAEFISVPEFGADLLSADVGLVASSPGLPPVATAPGHTAALRQTAQEAGIDFVGELALFAQGLRELDVLYAYRPKVLAITGSNGKTTVTSMVAKLAQAAGARIEVAGNIGPCLLDRLRAGLQGHCLPQVWVLELSSFQLHDGQGFAPSAACVLNISEDHLDWHGSMAAYVDDKLKIFAPNTTAVVNRAASESALRERIRSPRQIHFGLDHPEGHLHLGLTQHAGMRWLEQCQSDLGDTPLKKNQQPEYSWQRLMPTDGLKIRGQHNISNALAALGLISAIDLPLGPALRALADYTGEPHRLQPLAEVAGVGFVDDSKGTNVGATVAAIDSLGAELKNGQRLWLILGGDGKGQNFAPLTSPLAQYAGGAALIGQDAAALAAALPAGMAQQQCPSMAEAVQWCAAQAQAGDVVLLSPACASIDMYANYVARAADFAQAVAALEQGAV